MQRATRQREAIFATFAVEGRPLSPQEVLAIAQQTVPNLSLATVYRNLNALVEAGDLRLVDLPGQGARYEPSVLGHHHHFQCTRCDRVFDVPGCVGRVDRLAPDGFEVESHEIVLFGRCADCASGR